MTLWPHSTTGDLMTHWHLSTLGDLIIHWHLSTLGDLIIHWHLSTLGDLMTSFHPRWPYDLLTSIHPRWPYYHLTNICPRWPYDPFNFTHLMWPYDLLTYNNSGEHTFFVDGLSTTGAGGHATGQVVLAVVVTWLLQTLGRQTLPDEGQNHLHDWADEEGRCGESLQTLDTLTVYLGLPV